MALGIHIFGASGSGTTTLGRAVAERLGHAHFDTDDYFWQPTDPPYVTIRPPEERQRQLRADLERVGGFVLSGSICGRGDYWGRPFVERFGLVVFLYVPTAVRMRRLLARERARFGTALEPGGAMHEEHVAFMRWAEQYDTFPPTERSLALHEEWMATLSCPILEIRREEAVADMVDKVVYSFRSAVLSEVRETCPSLDRRVALGTSPKDQPSATRRSQATPA